MFPRWRTLEAVARYLPARRRAALAATEAKQHMWEEFREAMDKDLQSGPRCF